MLISLSRSDVELNMLYGWSLDRVPAALDRLREFAKPHGPDPTLQEPLRIVSIGLLRGIVFLQRYSQPFPWTSVRRTSDSLVHPSRYLSHRGLQEARKNILPAMGLDHAIGSEHREPARARIGLPDARSAPVVDPDGPRGQLDCSSSTYLF